MSPRETNVLIVDDEPNIRILVGRKLKSAGYQIVMAQDAKETLEILKEDRSIDVVLLDIRLPVVNGISVFETIKRDHPDKKIIVTSSLSREDQKFLIEEADAYYDKCEKLTSLVDIIEEVMHKKSRLQKTKEEVQYDYEKRIDARVPTKVIACCSKDKRITTQLQFFLSCAVDLSTQGARLISSKNVDVGDRLSMSLEIPVMFIPLLINCQVVWVKKITSSDRAVEVGVKFTVLDKPEDEERLKGYLDSLQLDFDEIKAVGVNKVEAT